MRSVEVKSFGGKDIYEVSGEAKGFKPVGGRAISLKQESPNHISYGADHAFCMSVLLRCVWLRETGNDTVSLAKGIEIRVPELATIIAL